VLYIAGDNEEFQHTEVKLRSEPAYLHAYVHYCIIAPISLSSEYGGQEKTMTKIDQTPEGWDGIAVHYEAIFEKLTIQFAQKTTELLNIKPDERVIDVAAGTGAFSLPAARRGAQVLATDFAPGMVAELRNRISKEALQNIHTAVMDGQALEVEDASFDVGASILGLIFFPDVKKGLSELRRVLVPGGRVGIVCWGNPAKSEFKAMIMRAVKSAVPNFQLPQQPPVWARMAGEESLSSHLVDAGFRDVTVTTVTGQLEIDNPTSFWNDFVRPGPAQAELFSPFSIEQVDNIGRALVDLLDERRNNGISSLASEACIGIGYRDAN